MVGGVALAALALTVAGCAASTHNGPGNLTRLLPSGSRVQAERDALRRAVENDGFPTAAEAGLEV